MKELTLNEAGSVSGGNDVMWLGGATAAGGFSVVAGTIARGAGLSLAASAGVGFVGGIALGYAIYKGYQFATTYSSGGRWYDPWYGQSKFLYSARPKQP